MKRSSAVKSTVDNDSTADAEGAIWRFRQIVFRTGGLSERAPSSGQLARLAGALLRLHSDLGCQFTGTMDGWRITIERVPPKDGAS